jgi:hypothetical protein
LGNALEQRAQRRRNARTYMFKGLTAWRRSKARHVRWTIGLRVGKVHQNLGPREPFPAPERHFAPVRVEFRGAQRAAGDRRRRLSRSRQIAANDDVEGVASQELTERTRLRAPGFVQFDVALPLETAVGVPRRTSVTYDDEFAAQFARNGFPSCETSRSCMSLACSSSIAKMCTSMLRVVGSLSAK